MTEQESIGREQYFTASTQLSPGSLRSNPKFAIYILCAHFGSYITLPQFPLLDQELLKGWAHLFKKPLCLSGSAVCPVLGKRSINGSFPMSESAGIDSLGQEQSYSWGFLRRKNQPLAPQGLLSVFLYLA